jgi:hypothetical protein
MKVSLSVLLVVGHVVGRCYGLCPDPRHILQWWWVWVWVVVVIGRLTECYYHVDAPSQPPPPFAPPPVPPPSCSVCSTTLTTVLTNTGSS